MVAIVLGLVGIGVGFVLDALIVRLGVYEPDDDEEDGEFEGNDTEPIEALAERPSVHAEAGALVVPSETDDWRAWLRRLVVVCLTAGLFAVAGARFEGPAELALVTAYICVFVICAGTDLLAFRVPNVVTYPAILLALAAAVLMPDADIRRALAGGAIAGGILLLPSLITAGAGMGMGDVKLATFLGLALGFPYAVGALLLTAFAGGIISVLLMVTRLRGRGDPIPYAPFISAGALTVLLWRGAVFADLA
jgi:prepilin signal peptidase PulO-like enzyme (type II secretory pathway)